MFGVVFVLGLLLMTVGVLLTAVPLVRTSDVLTLGVDEARRAGRARGWHLLLSGVTLVAAALLVPLLFSAFGLVA